MHKASPFIFIAAALTACTSQHVLNSRERAAAAAEWKKACDVRYTSDGFRVDPYQCAVERQELATQIRRSLAAEIAEAPACVASWHFSEENYRIFRIDPNSPTQAADVLSAGIVLDRPPKSTDSVCLRAMCKWRRKWEPEQWADTCHLPT